MPNDYDGDGKTDYAIYRKSNGAWWIAASSGQNINGFIFGISEDKPVPADYDGDGKADIAVYRPSTGVWYVLKSADNSFFAVQYGLGTDTPVPGDYDGDGKANITVFRDGIWYVLKSDYSTAGIYWGTTNDVPFFNNGLFNPTVGAYRASNNTYHISYAGINYGSAQPTGNSSSEIFVSSILPPQ